MAEVRDLAVHPCLASMHRGPQAEQLVGLQLALDVEGTGEGFRRARESGQHRALVSPICWPDAAVTADRGAENRLNAVHSLVQVPARAHKVGRQEGGHPGWQRKISGHHRRVHRRRAPGGPGEVELACRALSMHQQVCQSIYPGVRGSSRAVGEDLTPR